MEKQTQLALRVSKTSILVNLFLSFFKLAAGILAHSGAMVSDAIHSASDVFSTVIVMIGMKLSAKASDREHPYGHERMECVAAIVLAVVLLFTGLLIGQDSIEKIRSAEETLAVPGLLALIAALLSILVKEWMFRYTQRCAREIDSPALLADAWHHRSDALSSVGALVGIAGARLGFPICDSIASLVICVFIVKASYDIFHDAVDKMVDHSCDEGDEQLLRDCIREEEGVLRIDDLRTREFGNKVYVDVEIAADGDRPLKETHAIAERVHDHIEEKFPKVKHVMVHVNPYEES